MNTAKCIDNLEDIIFPMLPSTSLGFPRVAFHYTAKDTRLEVKPLIAFLKYD
jgi:hypothetical protein